MDGVIVCANDTLVSATGGSMVASNNASHGAGVFLIGGVPLTVDASSLITGSVSWLCWKGW